MWVASSQLPRSAGNPFYERLNRVLDEAGFDVFAEEQCAKFYADGVGRPSLAPGRYLGFLIRKVTGVGTPRSLQSRGEALVAALIVVLNGLWRPVARFRAAIPPGSPDPVRIGRSTWLHLLGPAALRRGHSATGC